MSHYRIRGYRLLNMLIHAQLSGIFWIEMGQKKIIRKTQTDEGQTCDKLTPDGQLLLRFRWVSPVSSDSVASLPLHFAQFLVLEGAQNKQIRCKIGQETNNAVKQMAQKIVIWCPHVGIQPRKIEPEPYDLWFLSSTRDQTQDPPQFFVKTSFFVVFFFSFSFCAIFLYQLLLGRRAHHRLIFFVCFF